MSDQNELALFVFIDALGWEIFSRHDFLDGLWETAEPLETVLGYSCTCDPTILTGCMPHEHGHFSFFLADEAEKSPLRNLGWLNALPSKLVDRGRVRRWLSRAVAAKHGIDGYFQLYETPFDVLKYFDYSEKKDIYQPGGILGGQPTIFDELRSSGLPFTMSDWRRSEVDNFAHMQDELSKGDAGFAYLYLAGLDGILHAEGTASERVGQHLRWYERELNKLLETARCQYSDVRLYVFSDHGMTDVTRHLDLIKRIDELPLEFGKDYLAYYDSTMARFWFNRPESEELIRDLLSNVEGGRELREQELKDYGVLFNDGRYGELIFLCDPGVLICPSFMGKKPLVGMHGYDPHDQDSVASFATTSADCKSPKRLDGLFGLMKWEAERLSNRRRTASDAQFETVPTDFTDASAVLEHTS